MCTNKLLRSHHNDLNQPPADLSFETHLILNVGMNSFKHPLTGVLIGQEWLHLQTQMCTQMRKRRGAGGKEMKYVCTCVSTEPSHPNYRT